LPGLELLGEGLVAGLELGGIYKTRQYGIAKENLRQLTADHSINLGGRELANGVGDGNVGRAARGLLSGGNLEDTVDIDLEDALKNGLASLHRGDRSKSKLAEGGVVFAVDTLALVHRELDYDHN